MKSIIKKYFVILLLLVCIMNFFIICCNNSDTEEIAPAKTTKTLLENEDGNVFFYVSNQSYDIDPVDIQVNIDDKVAINQGFNVEEQDNWIEYIFLLSPGTHKISITSIKGDTTFEKEVEIFDNHWVVIEYWYYKDSFSMKKKFHFSISNKPIELDELL